MVLHLSSTFVQRSTKPQPRFLTQHFMGHLFTAPRDPGLQHFSFPRWDAITRAALIIGKWPNGFTGLSLGKLGKFYSKCHTALAQAQAVLALSCSMYVEVYNIAFNLNLVWGISLQHLCCSLSPDEKPIAAASSGSSQTRRFFVSVDFRRYSCQKGRQK